MTHQSQTFALDQIGELLAKHGFDGMARALTLLLNEFMKIVRARSLVAGPYERAEARRRIQARDHPTLMGTVGLTVP